MQTLALSFRASAQTYEHCTTCRKPDGNTGSPTTEAWTHTNNGISMKVFIPYEFDVTAGGTVSLKTFWGEQKSITYTQVARKDYLSEYHEIESQVTHANTPKALNYQHASNNEWGTQTYPWSPNPIGGCDHCNNNAFLIHPVKYPNKHQPFHASKTYDIFA